MRPWFIELSGKPLEEQEISDFENRHGIKLPADYRKFLLQANGGMFNPQMNIQVGDNVFCPFQFYALNDDRPYDLDRMCVSTDWPQGYKYGYLKIGHDPGGSGFFISTQKGDFGGIYFLDRELSRRPSKGLVKIAASFEEMLRHLTPQTLDKPTVSSP